MKMIRLDPLDDEFIGFFMRMGQLTGLDELSSRMMAILFITPEEVAMDDLAKITGYSLASISTRVKFLEAGNIVTKSCKPGTRKVYLFMKKDFMEMMKEHLFKRQEEKISFAKAQLPSIIKGYQGKAKTKEQKDKLKIIQNYHNSVVMFDQIITKVLKEMEK